jgi:hypothetical protein
MLWGVFFIAAVIAVGVTAWSALAMAEMVYGYPVGHDLIHRAARTRDERRFFPGDVSDLDDAFHRVIGTYRAD